MSGGKPKYQYEIRLTDKVIRVFKLVEVERFRLSFATREDAMAVLEEIHQKYATIPNKKEGVV